MAFNTLASQVKDLEDLKNICNASREKYKKIEKIKEKVDRLKGDERFKEVCLRYENMFEAENKVRRIKEIKVLYVDIPKIDLLIETNEFEAFLLMKKIESKKYTVDLVVSQLESKLKSLKLKFESKFLEKFKEIPGFPFESKGQIIGLNEKTEHDLKNILKGLADILPPGRLGEIITPSLTSSITSNFLADVETNQIEKPEWMLNYSKNLINLNIIHLLEKFEISHQTISKILFHILPEINKVLHQRLENDVKKSISSQSESLFLHIVDSVLEYDKFLFDINSPEYLISYFFTEQFISLWLSYEKVYITTEIQKILKEDSWTLERTQGNKYKNLEDIFLLHQSLNIKYYNINSEDIKERLMKMMNDNIVNLYIKEAEKKILSSQTTLFYYDSNPTFWAEVCKEKAVLHQTLFLFQQFLLKIDQNSFAEKHFEINQLKGKLKDKLLKLVGDSLDDLVSDYLKTFDNKQPGSLNIKKIKQLLKDLNSVAQSDLAYQIVQFSLQTFSKSWTETLNAKSKKLSQELRESVKCSFKQLFDLLSDSESSENFLKRLNF